MLPQPILQTERLTLRPFTMSDVPEVQRLVAAREIAATTATIPHPYPEGGAESWIKTHPAKLEENKGVTYAIELREEKSLCGAIGLVVKEENNRAELGYWIGVPYWGKGYCTEAAYALVNFGFHTLNLNRIYAFHMVKNPASGRVLQKTGMQNEGTLRQHILKWGEYQDVVCYGLLRDEWESKRR